MNPDPNGPQERRSLPEQGAARPASVGIINILLVDDEPKNLTALETVLDDPNYRLVRAGSADEALLTLVAGDFALLVLDIQMPEMNGFELAQLIKQRKKSAGIPIIFLTAFYGEDEHVLEGYSSGAVDYLHKPINAAVLRSKVAVFAELHRKTRESVLANEALTLEIAERKRAQERLRDLNAHLEQRVNERTAELARSEARLREADKRKDEFLAMLGHELRNPLAAIRHAVRIDGEGAGDTHSVRWASEVIDRQSAHLARLVDDLLDVERINRGRIDLRSEPIDLAAVLARACEAVQSLMEEKHHSFSLDSISELPVLGDPARLQQVFVNLFSNAAKYTEDGGKIHVIARRCAGEAMVQVADSGVGLSAEMLPHVFDLFTQAHTSLDRAQGGLGIGLTVARSLIEMHGGKIGAQSEGAGQGSVFTVRLPLIAQQQASTLASEATPAEAAPMETDRPGGASIRVLVVDDHRDAGDTLAQLLARRGCEVRVARDGLEGLAAARQFLPEVLLLDLGLPSLDGYELCRTLRGDPAFASSRFIATSGYAQTSDVERSMKAGFDLHFAKPVDFPELVMAIRGSRKS